ncbi:MAG: peptidyl-prolyl cis-trans isomerase [Reyranellaceae bacterium]
MLQAMRNSSKSVIAVIMFMVLIVTFAVWGIGDIFRNTAVDPVAATVGDVNVHSRQVRELFNQDLEQRQRTGQPLTFEQAVQVGLPNLALESLIGEALRGKLAAEKGFVITDDYLRSVITSEPMFRNELGAFDRQRYGYFLQQQRMNEAMHLAELRRDFGTSQFFTTLQAGVAVPPDYLDAIYRFRFERRQAQIALLPFGSVRQTPAATDEALKTFYEAHKNAFAQPEYRKLAYVYVKAEDVLAEIKVSEQRIREEYDTRRNEFTKPEARAVDQVLLDSEDKARQLAELLAKGTAWDEAARQVLGRDGGVISLGEVVKADLPPGLADPAFELPLNGTTQPVRSPLGWHVLRVTKITPADVKPIEEMREQIAEIVKRSQAPEILVQRANDLERQLNRGTSLADAARSIGAEVKTVEAIDANGVGRDGLPATDIANVRELTRRAFNARKGDESGLTELPSGDFFVFQVIDVMPARVPELAEVKDRVTDAWQQAEIAKLAEAQAKTIADKANAGEDLAALLKAEGIELGAPQPLARSANRPEENLPRALVQAVFAAAPGKVVYAQAPNGIAIARLQEIQPADPAKDGAGVDATRAQILGSLQESVAFALDAALRERYPVNVDNAVMTQTFAVER